MPSSSGEKRLVPSIHVTIHPTVEKEKKKESAAAVESDETQESASDQEVVEKLIGAKITGGIEFNMPLTIFDVVKESKAGRVGLKLGDEIVSIEGKLTSSMSLKDAYKELLLACKHVRSFKLHIMRYLDDSSSVNLEFVLDGNPRAPRILLEQKLTAPITAYVQKPERMAWHPVMWPHPEYFLPDDYHEELPHKRIVRNVRKLLTSNPSRVELENLFTALPRGSRPKRNYDDDDD